MESNLDSHRIRWRDLHQLLEHKSVNHDFRILSHVFTTAKDKGYLSLLHVPSNLILRASFKRDEPIEFNMWPEDFIGFVEDSDDDDCCGHSDGWIALKPF